MEQTAAGLSTTKGIEGDLSASKAEQSILRNLALEVSAGRGSCEPIDPRGLPSRANYEGQSYSREKSRQRSALVPDRQGRD